MKRAWQAETNSSGSSCLGLADQLVVAILAAGGAAHFEAGLGGQADEGIAAEALAALHRLEQIGPGLVGELEVNGKRGIEVREGFEDNGIRLNPLRGELPEFRSVMTNSGNSRKREKRKRQLHQTRRQERQIGASSANRPEVSSSQRVLRVSDEFMQRETSDQIQQVGEASVTIASQSSSCTVQRARGSHRERRIPGSRRTGSVRCRSANRRSPASRAGASANCRAI